MLRFASPWVLLAVPLVVVLLVASARRRRARSASLPLPQAGERLRHAGGPWVAVDAAMPWVRGGALVLLLFALARPQASSTLETTSTLGVDIVIVLDTSQSMLAEDFQPDHRLGAAKRSIETFVAGRASDRIGLVSFGSIASTRCPLTLDHAMLLELLQSVQISPRDEGGTAIGMGLATAVNRLRESEAQSRVVVLLTDGANNEGEISPEGAAQAAKALGVRVYTIGVGTTGPVPVSVDAGGGRTVRVNSYFELDEDLLQEIAQVTDGQYFNVLDENAMQTVFETIDALEKSEIESRERVLYRELFAWFLVPACVLLFSERGLRVTRLRRIP